MFCFKRNFKVINENFDEIEKDLDYFKSELTSLRAQNNELQKEIDSLKEKHQKTKKNLVRIVDTFTLKEYVLFKTRLLTKKQTETLLEKIYEHYYFPLEYRSEDGINQLQSLVRNPHTRPSSFDEELTLKNITILTQIRNFKKILNKLDEPALKNEDYFMTKLKWLANDGLEYTELLDNIIQILKTLI
jgi:chromosome segregation ATPase